jgi:hypothetical protein
LGGLVGGSILSAGLTLNEGDPGTDHYLTQSDAQLYITRYNRALLRKAVRDAQRAYQDPVSIRPREPPSIAVTPVVSPGFTGIMGTF